MIYTVGRSDIYEEYIARDRYPRKAAGGSVWKNRNEAEEFAGNGFNTYGVLARWGQDTEPVDELGANWHALKKAAELVKLETNG